MKSYFILSYLSISEELVLPWVLIKSVNFFWLGLKLPKCCWVLASHPYFYPLSTLILYMQQAIFTPPTPVRGGIPICFPQVFIFVLMIAPIIWYTQAWQFEFWTSSLENEDHWSNMDLPGTRFGLSMIILHHYSLVIPVANLLSTCFSNHLKMISRSGRTGNAFLNSL